MSKIIIRRMIALARHPALRLGLTFAVILLLRIQPNWTPLLDDLRIARSPSSAPAESVAAIMDAYTRQPWHAQRAAAAGMAALAAGKYEAAITTLNTAASLGRWTPELRIALGDAHNAMGNIDQAIAEWQIALPDRLDDSSLLTKLAVAYEKAARYPEAAAALRSLVAVQPNNAVAQYRFGVVLAVIDPPAAPAHLALASGLDPSVQPFAESLNRAVEAGLEVDDEAYTFGIIGYTLIGLREYPLAKAALLNAVTQRPDFAEAYAYLGLAEDYLGNDGTYAYQRSLDLDGELPAAHYLFGLHYRRLRDNTNAIASLKRAFDLDPSNAGVAAELGSAYTELGELTTAETWYVQAVNVAPDDPSFWLLLAKFYVEHDLKVDADGLLAAQKAVELAPDSAEANDTLGFAQYLNADFARAEENLLKAQSIDPNLASAYFHLGLLYLDTGRTAEAKQPLEAAIALDAGGPTAERAIQALARLGITAPPPTSTP